MTNRVPNIPLDQLSDLIAEVSAHIDAATCWLMDLIIEFDRNAGWEAEGANSCVQWLSWRLGWRPNTASERLRVAYALRDLPLLYEAFSQGRVSYSKMRAVTRVATPETDAEWLNITIHSTAAQCEKIVQKTRRASETANLVVENARHTHRQLHTYWDANGMFVIEGRLPPELGAIVEKALEAEAETLRGEEKEPAPAAAETPPTSFSQRKADALARVAEKSLRGKSGDRAADRYQVVVHVDAEVLADPETLGRCELEDGPALSAESVRRLTCDGSLVTMLHDTEGNILNVGRKTRAISAGMRRALDSRDPCCRFPGCDCRRTDGHHIEHWIDDGETKLENLILICRRHHRLIHEGGFTVSLDDTGEPVFNRPNGSVIPNNGSMPALRVEPTAEIIKWNKQAGLSIDADTNLSEWDGESPQYDYIAEVMSGLTASRQSTVARDEPAPLSSAAPHPHPEAPRSSGAPAYR